MIIKKSVRVAIGAFLLLCFSLAAFPLDFFHNHAAEISCSKNQEHGTCQHKFHIAKKASSCFVCNIHFDKNFIASQASQHFRINVESPQFLQKAVVPYHVTRPLSSLRGPPISPLS